MQPALFRRGDAGLTVLENGARVHHYPDGEYMVIQADGTLLALSCDQESMETVWAERLWETLGRAELMSDEQFAEWVSGLAVLGIDEDPAILIAD